MASFDEEKSEIRYLADIIKGKVDLLYTDKELEFILRPLSSPEHPSELIFTNTAYYRLIERFECLE